MNVRLEVQGTKTHKVVSEGDVDLLPMKEGAEDGGGCFFLSHLIRQDCQAWTLACQTAKMTTSERLSMLGGGRHLQEQSHPPNLAEKGKAGRRHATDLTSVL